MKVAYEADGKQPHIGLTSGFQPGCFVARNLIASFDFLILGLCALAHL